MAKCVNLQAGQRLKRKRGDSDVNTLQVTGVQYEVITLPRPDECNSELFNEEKSSDATLHWLNKVLPVHKYVLSLYSTTLRAAILKGQASEASEASPNVTTDCRL